MTDNEFLTLALGVLSVLMAIGLALLWLIKKPRQIGYAIASMVCAVPIVLVFWYEQVLVWLGGVGAPLMSLIQSPVALISISSVLAVLAFALIFLLRKYTHSGY